MDVYPRAHLIDYTRCKARRYVREARSWRQEADASLSYFTPRQCRTYARSALRFAGAYRRRLLVLRNMRGRYVPVEQWRAIERGEW